jgi:hypothetical protein
MLLLLKHLAFSLQSLQEVLLLGDGVEQCAVVPLSIEEAVDELFGVLYVSIAADHVVCVFYLAVVGDDAFHLVLEEALQEEVSQQDVDALLLL